MKQWITYIVLFCLLFLNAPRYLVHDCDNHQHGDIEKDQDSDEHFKAEDCFVCTFDLDVYQVPEIKSFKYTPIPQERIVEAPIALIDFEGIDPAKYRGPPQS